jgi:hypothetical protein
VKLTTSIAIVALVGAIVGTVNSWAQSNISDVIPESELLEQGVGQGQITTGALAAIEAADYELAQKWNLRSGDFVSISVRQVLGNFHVVFSNRELSATYFGSPGDPRPVIIRVDGTTYKVLGSYQYK